MWRYVVMRVGQLIVTLFIASVVVFLVIEHAPGNPVLVQLGLNPTHAEIVNETRKLGLNDPLPQRYAIWISQAVRLNLGKSFSTGLPVTQTITQAFGNTFRLTVMAVLLGFLLGAPLGVLAALRRGGKLDAAISSFAALGLSVPNFAVGTLLILVFSVHFKLMPSAGGGIPGQSFVSALKFTLMPAITLAIPFAAVFVRYVRMELGEGMSQPYILTSRSLGLRPVTVVYNGWRNAMIPTLTVMGIQIGRLLAGAVVTETVFSYPGLGYLTIQSIQSLDYPVVEGVLLVAAAVFLLVMFVVDLLVGLADPRVRLGSR
jgi:ABC-type dipeptide/oligopeptide/nickel transport system permease component